MKYRVLLFLIFYSTHSHGQKINLDSVEQKINLLKDDTIKVNALNELCSTLIETFQDDSVPKYTLQVKEITGKLIANEKNKFVLQRLKSMSGYAYLNIGKDYFNHQGKYKEALSNFNLALNLSEEAKDEILKANAYSGLGSISMVKGEYENATELCNKAIDIFEKHGRKKDEAKVFQKLGMIYNHDGVREKSIVYYKKASTLYDEIGDKKKTAGVYETLAGVYKANKEIKKAIESQSEALKIYEKLNDSNQMAFVMDNLGYSYLDLQNSQHALSYFHNSLSIHEKLKSDGNVLKVLSDILGVYRKENNNEKVKEYLKKQFTICERKEDFIGMVGINNEIGDIFKKEGDSLQKQKKNFEAKEKYQQGLSAFAKSIETFKKIKPTSDNNANLIFTSSSINIKTAGKSNEGVLTFSKENGIKQLLQNCYKGLAETFSALSQFDSAYKYQVLYSGLKDSILTESDLKFQNEYQAKLKTSVQALELTHQKTLAIQQSKLKNIFIIGFVIVLIFSFVFFIQRNRISKEKRYSEIQRKRSDELLLNILPSEVAEELKQKGESEAKQFDDVTVLLTDFVNFTGISERLTPKELVSEIHHCFTAFDEIIERNGLEKIKTTGDAYLAVCGLPNEDKQHAKKAVTAGQEILKFMNERKKEIGLQDGLGVVRIGINSGSVVAGIVGVKKFAYDIWGDTVNIAARMEQNCETGKINISGATYELVKNDFTCIHRGKIDAKNKGEIDMYFVESVS